MTDAITIRGLTKRFGPTLAVKDLNLSVPAGSLCGFIGPNGAGKTTTIRMIMSIIFPDSGELTVLGRTAATESKDRIGYLPEERGVYKKMRVRAFLAYMAKLKGVDPAAASQKAAWWLERVGLPEVAKKKCEELSKGMQQKVQFIAAVIHEPDLLILDEVFSGLDPVNRKLMRELIDEQHSGGRTIVFSTHAMYEAEQLCERVFMIHRGEKVLDSTLRDIRSKFDPRTLVVEPIDRSPEGLRAVECVQDVRASEDEEGVFEAYLKPEVSAATAVRSIASAVDVCRVEVKRVTLEDVFIQIVEQSGQRVDRDALRAGKDGAGQPALAAGGQGR